jgi:hypothetical protein
MSRLANVKRVAHATAMAAVLTAAGWAVGSATAHATPHGDPHPGNTAAHGNSGDANPGNGSENPVTEMGTAPSASSKAY